MNIRFGTEGWRAIMAEEFTAANVRLVTQAIADHLRAARSRGRVVVGYDTRFLSDRFANVVAEVLAGNGLHVVLGTQAVPTCAVSRYVVSARATAGIVVTASHNPPEYNGLKVKESFGGSATTETVASIERRLGRTKVKRVAMDDALARRMVRRADLAPRYLQGLRQFVNLPAIRRSRLRVVADPMHGAAGRTIEQLVSGGGGRCRVETIRADADPRFGGQAPEPIASHLVPLRNAVRRSRADLGIANDGDADRIGIIAPDGAWLNPGQVLCLLLEHLVGVRRMGGAVVKTVSNTMMINRMADDLGLRLFEVPVGFKHVARLMLEEDIVIGGEESGGIGVKGYLPERDGIANGLLLLEAMAMSRRRLPVMLRDLERRYGRWCYGRRDLHVKPSQVERLFTRLSTSPPGRMAHLPVTRINRLDGMKLMSRDDSWLLFRRSGTEPIVRIYAESPSSRTLQGLLAFGVRLATAR